MRCYPRYVCWFFPGRFLNSLLPGLILLSLSACGQVGEGVDGGLPGRAGLVISFDGSASYTVGNSPRSVAMGDLDNDGIPDMAVVNSVSNDASVLMGVGDGTFGPVSFFMLGTEPYAVALGDLDNDGNLDLASANRGSDDVSVLMGNGAGGFGAAAFYSAGTGPRSIRLGDFDSDGILDIVAANELSNNFSLLIGDGLGGFGAPVNVATNPVPFSLNVDDLDGDGNLDIAVASRPGFVDIFLGNGSGSFSGPGSVPLTSSQDYQDVEITDLNNDGIPDLAVPSFADFNVVFFLGNGDGTFSLLSETNAKLHIFTVTAGDINGDGWVDMTAGSSSLAIIEGDGSGTFLGDWLDYGVLGNIFSIVLEDLDNDGDLDLVATAVSSSFGDRVVVLLSSSTPPTSTPSTSTTMTSTSSTTSTSTTTTSTTSTTSGGGIIRPLPGRPPRPDRPTIIRPARPVLR